MGWSHFCQGFLRAATATTSCGIEFLDCLQPTIATSYMAVTFESVGAEYLCQIVKLHHSKEILQADLVIGGDTAHPANHSSVVALQAVQVGEGWGPGFTCTEHDTSDTRIVNYSFGGDGQWAGGEYGQEILEIASCEAVSCDNSEFTTATRG